MNSLTDQQLLRDYIERRSETAFAELVRRHVDFVYSAALRMTDEPIPSTTNEISPIPKEYSSMAEDASQRLRQSPPAHSATRTHLLTKPTSSANISL